MLVHRAVSSILFFSVDSRRHRTRSGISRWGICCNEDGGRHEVVVPPSFVPALLAWALRQCVFEMEIFMQWICDTCGARINNVSDGWVEWQSRNENDTWIKHSPRLVHHRPSSPRPSGCQYDEDALFANGGNIVGDLPLGQLVDTEGLISLLSFVSDGHFELEQCLELIKRIQVPDYDLVRGYFDEAISEGVFEPNTKPGYYDVGAIQAVKRWLDERG